VEAVRAERRAGEEGDEALLHEVDVLRRGVESAHQRADAGPDDHVDGDLVLDEDAQNAHVRQPARGAAAERETDLQVAERGLRHRFERRTAVRLKERYVRTWATSKRATRA